MELNSETIETALSRKPGTYERAAEPDDWGTDYDMLVGPEGFECLLTESEDRTWYRDGRPVVEQLNSLQADNQTLAALCRQLDGALMSLYDEQNGPPLKKWESSWREAMAECEAAHALMPQGESKHTEPPIESREA